MIRRAAFPAVPLCGGSTGTAATAAGPPAPLGRLHPDHWGRAEPALSALGPMAGSRSGPVQIAGGGRPQATAAALGDEPWASRRRSGASSGGRRTQRAGFELRRN
jgi:hypothetical protein